MPGNELLICDFLLNNVGRVDLRHLGVINSLGSPNGKGIIAIKSSRDVSPEDSSKKADIYINGLGVSLKQMGGGFSFNRLQRASLSNVYSFLGFSGISAKLHQIDAEVRDFHNGLLERRNRPWEDFFSESDFKIFLEFLMMRGSPSAKVSHHPASLILEAPSSNISEDNISVHTFEEYFESYKRTFKIAIRRQWIGQSSNSEHTRAVGIAKKTGNAQWVFNNIVGAPRSGWRSTVAPQERKTVYFLMIEKES